MNTQQDPLTQTFEKILDKYLTSQQKRLLIDIRARRISKKDLNSTKVFPTNVDI